MSTNAPGTASGTAPGTGSGTAPGTASVDHLRAVADALAHVDVSLADRAGCERVISALAVVRRRLDACDVRLARRLADLAAADPSAPPPEHTMAAASRTDSRTASRTADRSRTAAAVPQLGQQLDRGAAAGEHVDVVGQVLARLPADRREEFSARHGAALAAAAATSTPDELRRLAVAFARAFQDEAGKEARLERQRRSNRLRTWVDRLSGMVRLSGEIDPERGQALLRRLHDEVEARFHGGVPDTAPDDPGERQDHLRALALCGALLDPVGRPCGGGCRSAGARRPETITVIDVETFRHGPHCGSHVDLGADGLDLPLDTIRRRAALGEIVPVWIDGDGVVVRVGDPAAALDLGRTTRLANRAQRQALRVMYTRCPIPGCCVAFDHCEPHHLVWWRRGGRTDLRNLLPLCSRHHHLVHEGGWAITMASDRSLTITLPDGSVMRTGPPRSERR